VTLPIEVKGLVKHYGRTTALNEVNLTVGEGEIYGLLGPNGAGKSTLLRVLLGLVRPNKGSALVFDADARSEPQAVSRTTSALVEGAGLYPHLTVRQNLKVFARLDGVSDIAAAVDAGIASARLEEAADRLYRRCSAGMRQRLKLAVAFSSQARLVLLDEPTTALDAQSVAECKDRIRRQCRDHGTTFLLSSHRLAEMEDICSSAAILRAGTVLASGSLKEMLKPTGAVRVRTPDPKTALAAAQQAGFEGCVLPDGDLEVTAPGEAAAELNRCLVTAGVDVSALVPCAPTLEEKYLSLCQVAP
jgi:ABC-2 type transport system ATP-binding protein